MRRIVTSLDALDGETREAAEHAARRSGVSLEDWIASALAEHTARPKAPAARPRPQASDPFDAAVVKVTKATRQNPSREFESIIAAAAANGERQSRDHSARTAVALDSVASWIEKAEQRLNQATRTAAGQQERIAEILSGALGDIKERLDTVERRAEAAPRPDPSLFPAAPLVDALSALQHDVADLGQRLNASKEDVWSPVVDRIRGDIDRLHDTIANLATHDEVSTIEAAVQELAQTLGKPRPAQDIAVLVGSVASLQRQVHRLSDEVTEGLPQRMAAEVEGLKRQIEVVAASGIDRSVIATLEAELGAMHQTLAGLVEPQRVERLSEEVALLARHMADMRLNQVSRSDFAGLKGALEDIRAHLHDVRSSHPTASQFESLNERLDLLVSRSAPDGAAPVMSQLAALTERLAPVPERLEQMAERLSELASRSDRAGLAPLTKHLTEIAVRLGTLEARPEAPSLAPVIEQLSTVSDRLAALAPLGGPDPITEQLSGLTERLSALASQADPSPRVVTLLERVSAQVEAMSHDLGRPHKELLDRLDRLEDSVRQIGQETSTASLELMLQAFGEKLEQAAAPNASLDGLEAQIAGLTVQLERAAAAPPLQHVLSETLAEVKELREDANAIAERAAKAALKDAKSGAQANPAPGNIDSEALRQGLAELKSLQDQADRKTQYTLKAVHNALETLVLRFPSQGPMVSRFSEPSSGGPPPSIDPFPAMRLEAAVRKLHKAAIAHAEEITATSPGAAPDPAGEPEEVLLEPGAPRPATPAPTASFTASVDDEPGNVRANFIAAARRATQTTTPDLPGPRTREDAEFDSEPQDGDEPSVAYRTLMERIRQSFDTHRRPLLLGLVLLILTAGTVEMISTARSPMDEPIEAAKSTMEAPADLAPSQPIGLSRTGDSGDLSKIGDLGKTGDVGNAAELGKTTESGKAAGSSKAPEAAPAAPATTGSLFQPTATEAQPVPSGAFTTAPKRVADVAGVGELSTALPGSLREAALAGDPAAVYEVASRTLEGRGVPRDPALAVRLFERTAQSGFVPAQARIGNLYEKGQGVARDLAVARTWYERAGISGNARAMHNLAVLFAEGIDGKPDFAGAQRWFHDAAEAGLRDSQFNLGVLLARGLGTAQDLPQSFKWFALAAAQGDEEASKKRDEVASRLSPADLSAAKALVERWRPRSLDPAANEVPVPAQGWSAMKVPTRRG